MKDPKEEAVTARHLGFALDSLIRAHDWKAKQLAVRAGVTPSMISAYVRGEGLDRDRLEELAGLMALGRR
jgi:transcriptional regulator with XRE-family HTH domain